MNNALKQAIPVFASQDISFDVGSSGRDHDGRESPPCTGKYRGVTLSSLERNTMERKGRGMSSHVGGRREKLPLVKELKVVRARSNASSSAQRSSSWSCKVGQKKLPSLSSRLSLHLSFLPSFLRFPPPRLPLLLRSARA
jgi:hypothetical protein